MEKYVFYETDKSVWFCPSRDWNKFKKLFILLLVVLCLLWICLGKIV